MAIAVYPLTGKTILFVDVSPCVNILISEEERYKNHTALFIYGCHCFDSTFLSSYYVSLKYMILFSFLLFFWVLDIALLSL